MALNKHQQKALDALKEKLEEMGLNEMAKLAEQIKNNDHSGILSNPAYWNKDLTTPTG